MVFITMAIFSHKAYAQKGESIFTGGLRLGMTMSQISGDDLAGFNHFGVSLAPTVNFPISKTGKWKMQMELQFETKGSRIPTRVSEDGTIIGQKYVLNLWYVGVPILFNCDIYKGLMVEFGPLFNVLVRSVEKDNYGVMQSRQPFRPVEFAGIIGFSYLIKEKYGVSLRWSSSIIPVRVPDFIYDRVQRKQFNDLLTLSMYYQF